MMRPLVHSMLLLLLLSVENGRVDVEALFWCRVLQSHWFVIADLFIVDTGGTLSLKLSGSFYWLVY